MTLRASNSSNNSIPGLSYIHRPWWTSPGFAMVPLALILGL